MRKFLVLIYYFLYLWKLIIVTFIPKILYNKRFLFIIITPEHENIGDHAIFLAEKELFKDFYIFEITEFKLAKIFKRYKYYKKSIDILFGKHLVLCHGGGSIGTLWENADGLLMDFISARHKNKIIILPQTIFVDNNISGEIWLEKARKVYNAHPNLTVCAREKISYELTKELLYNINKVYLIPDMVLSLNKCKKEVMRNGVALCLRNDCEKTINEEKYDEIVNFAQSKFIKILFADMSAGSSVTAFERETVVNEQFDKFRGAELVITDRLHGMIFAAITGTPCAVLNSKSHKVKGVYDWCLSDLEYIRFVDSVEEISEFYNQIKGKTFVYDNTKLKPYYEKLLELIK